MHLDFLIVGAGFLGLTFAERAATQLGARSLIVDRRAHIGGNAFDKYDDQGVLIHPYGPHYFRTNSPRVCDEIRALTPNGASFGIYAASGCKSDGRTPSQIGEIPCCQPLNARRNQELVFPSTHHSL